jgi:hypothetical protein
MEDTTKKMNKTTGDMAQTTQDLAKKTEDMKNTTNELYDALRQGNALQLRRDAWKSILEAPSMFKKISESAKYFMSYEVQLWNLYAQDITEEKRDILAQQAAQEFFLEIEDLAPRDGSVQITAMPQPNDIQSAENRAASFNALAVSMDQINRKQLNSLALRQDLSVISMESLMEDALLAKASINAGTAKLGTKAGYITEVLAHEAKAIQLLQTRYNFFPLMLIDATTAISEKSLVGKAAMITLGWDLDLSALNEVQLEYYSTKILQPAIAARELLKKIGVKPVMDGNLAKLLAKMRVKTAVKLSPSMAASQTKLIGLLQDIQKN